MTAPIIRDVPIQHFTMWHGEVHVTVFRQFGMHGFPDAVLVVRRPDDPMKTYQYNPDYYIDFDDFETTTEQKFESRRRQMDSWIENELVKLATGAYEVSEIDVASEKYMFA